MLARRRFTQSIVYSLADSNVRLRRRFLHEPHPEWRQPEVCSSGRNRYDFRAYANPNHTTGVVSDAGRCDSKNDPDCRGCHETGKSYPHFHWDTLPSLLLHLETGYRFCRKGYSNRMASPVRVSTEATVAPKGRPIKGLCAGLGDEPIRGLP